MMRNIDYTMNRIAYYLQGRDAFLTRSGKKGAFAYLRMLLSILLILVAATLLRSAVREKRNIASNSDSSRANQVPMNEETQMNSADAAVSYSLFCQDTLLGNEYLAVYLNHQQAEIHLEDRLVYRSEGTKASYAMSFPDHYWALVPLQKEDAGKQIHIRIRYNSPAVLLKARAEEPPVFLADKNSILLTIIEEECWSLALGVLSITIGLFGSVIPLLGHGGKEGRSITALGIFLAVSGLLYTLSLAMFSFVACDRDSGTGLAFLTTAAWVCYSLAPMLFFLFLKLEYDREPIYRTAVVLSVILTAALFLLALLDVQTLFAYILLTYLLRVLVLAVFAAQLVLLVKSRNDHSHPEWIAQLSVGILFFQIADIVIWNSISRPDFNDFAMLYSLFYSLFYTALRVRNAFHRRRLLYQAEKTVYEQQIQILSDQMRPHFIYNTLNTIYVLCDRDVEAAKQTIHDFSQYLRLKIDSMGRNTIPFSQELDRVKYYLSIEEQRFQDMLCIEYDAAKTDFKVPPLCVQPLVENAIRHGILPKNAPGTVKISTKETDNEWLVIVADDGVGFDPATLSDRNERQHLGIENVKARLLLMSNGSLDLKSKPGSGTTATIHLPKEK